MTPFQKILMVLGGLTLLFLAMLVIIGFMVIMFCVYCEIREKIDKRNANHLHE